RRNVAASMNPAPSPTKYLRNISFQCRRATTTRPPITLAAAAVPPKTRLSTSGESIRGARTIAPAAEPFQSRARCSEARARVRAATSAGRRGTSRVRAASFVFGEAMEAMAATMLTPGEMPSDEVPAPQSLAATMGRKWRRVPFQLTRRTVGPWLAVKGVLTGLVFSGGVGGGSPGALDPPLSL